MSGPRVAVIVPARMASSRFPGKPLCAIAGLPMVEHVRRRAALAPGVDEVHVATCDREIRDAVEAFGGSVIMTADTHLDCTDRVEEASRSLAAGIILLVQGDEPLLDPSLLPRLVDPLLRDDSLGCTNLLSVIHDRSDLDDPDVVKAAMALDGSLLFLSRAPIPLGRREARSQRLRQTGMSAFRRALLARYAKLEPTPLELTEAVGFLRLLENGIPIRGVVTERGTVGVDRLADVSRVEALLRDDPLEASLLAKITAS